ncbi:MAG TPA: UMP kinase, partial [Candidatus Nanoarchaeia archaeon]
MKEPTVISLGGSLIVPNGGIDHKFLKRFCQLILRFVDEGSKFLIVAGGGKTCRHYQEAARRIVSLDDEDVDWLGIHTTRLN